MSAPPGGIITFLFTDVEGSTRLAKALGDAAWAALLEDHRRLLRQAFAAHGGHEVDTQGDAFFVVFARPIDALAAAVEAQQAVEAHPWPHEGRVRVRLGLHTGEALVRGQHYIGQEVHRASRICDSGHGGQIVVSQPTAELVRESLPAETTLVDLGRHSLKDLDEPQRLFQVGGPGLCSAFPRLRTLDAPNNLPAERSSFVGREKEIGILRRLLGEHRLVTLTGIGGCGKTRLALRAGAQHLRDFADGVFFIDLAPITDDALVSQAFATACGLSLDVGGGVSGALDDQLVAALSRRKCLLLVDNCEHLLDAVADLVDRLLAGSSRVAVLATSREALDVEGEQVVRVASLGVPDDASEAASSEAASSEAVRLFVERATSVKPGFYLDSQTLSAVVEICRRLDGIPLAIEFAAARIAHLSAQQVAERLEDRFRLLTGGRRRIQRQQTLSGTLDWSHDLLDEREQKLFRRLAVFAGGAGLDAVEGVGAGDDIPMEAVLDLLGSLVAKSLVVSVEDERGEARYRLLETVRMYAADKLAAAGEAEAVRGRHRDWYLGWLESVPFERLSFTPAGLRALFREADNLRAAADWCERDERPDLLARLATRMYGVSMDTRSALSDRRQRLGAALRHAERLSTRDRMACHAMLGAAAWSALETEVPIAEATRAIDLAGGQPDPFLVMAFMTRSFAHSVLAAASLARDVEAIARARRDAEASVAAAGSGLPPEWRAYAQFNGWMIETNMGADMRAAAAWAAACMESAASTEATSWLRYMPLVARAVSHHLLGEHEQALRASLRFRALSEVTDMPAIFASMAIEIAPALVAGGEEEMGMQVLRDAVPFVRRVGTPLAENHLLSMFAYVEHLLGRPERAGRLLGAARYLGGAVNLPIPFRTPASWSLYRHYLPLVRAAVGPEESRRARDEGRAMTLDTALAYALEGT